ncbi:hypothetical protein CR513_10178, partial [Mucuna pruriens]
MKKKHEIGRKKKSLMISFHILKKVIKKLQYQMSFLFYLYHQLLQFMKPHLPKGVQKYVDETEIINDLFCLFVDSEPLTFDESMEDKRWRQVMKEEIKAIKKNDNWELSNLPKGHEVIGVKWVFKIKKNAKEEVERYKARLVAKGYKQQHGVYYDEVFAPVTCMETIRLLISVAAQMGWGVFQKLAFLNGYLEKNVYVEQPMGFAIKGQEEKVLKLKKALYDLKQALRAGIVSLTSTFKTMGLFVDNISMLFMLKKLIMVIFS